MKINLSIKQKTWKEKLANYFGFAPITESAKYNKPAPKYKREVLDIIAKLNELKYKQIGTIQDEFVYILMFANATDTYYLHINFDGEYVGIFKRINCQHIATLCKMLENPNQKIIAARDYLESASNLLYREIQVLTIANKRENAQEFFDLTEREKKAVAALKYGLNNVRAASVLLRDKEND